MLPVYPCAQNTLISQSQSHTAGADPGFDQGGAQIVTGLKLPFWGLSFVEFWCWGLIFGGQGGARVPRAPLDPPLYSSTIAICLNLSKVFRITLKFSIVKHPLQGLTFLLNFQDMCRNALYMRFWWRLTNIRLTVGFSAILGNGY